MTESILLQSGIYVIVNMVNGKCYVGSAVCFKKRFSAHRALLQRGAHHSSKLQRAWRKYGESAFQFQILVLVEDRSKLIATEQLWIDTLAVCGNAGYNVCVTAGSPRMGMETSPEHRAKLSAAHKGNSHALGYRHTPEALVKIAEASRNMSAETRLKISQAGAGRKMSDEARAHLSALHRGLQHTAAARRKMSDSAKGKVISQATREKLRIANEGRVLSTAHREKIAESIRAHWVTRRVT